MGDKGSGGAGRGQGRKRKLDPEAIEWVNIFCDDMARKIFDEDALAAADPITPATSRLIGSLFDGETKDMRLAERRALRAKKLPPGDEDALEDHCIAFEKALKIDKGILPRNVDALDEDGYLEAMESVDHVKLTGAWVHGDVARPWAKLEAEAMRRARAELKTVLGIELHIDTIRRVWRKGYRSSD